MSVTSKKEYLAKLYAAQKKTEDDFEEKVKQIREKQAARQNSSVNTSNVDTLRNEVADTSTKLQEAYDHYISTGEGADTFNALNQKLADASEKLASAVRNPETGAIKTDARAVYQAKGTQPDAVANTQQSAEELRNRILNPNSTAAKKEALSTMLSARPAAVRTAEQSDKPAETSIKNTEETAAEIQQGLRNKAALEQFNATGTLPNIADKPVQTVAEKEETVLPGVTRPFTREEQLSNDIGVLEKKKEELQRSKSTARGVGRENYQKEIDSVQKQIDTKKNILSRMQNTETEEDNTPGWIKALNTVSYTTARGGVGTMDTVENWASAVQSTFGDLLTGGEYSDTQNKIGSYLNAHPELLDGLYGMHQTSADGKTYVNAANTYANTYAKQNLANAVGVTVDDVNNYLKTHNADFVRSGLNQMEGVSDFAKDKAGAWAESIGQQIPGILLSAGNTPGKDLSAVSKFIADNVSTLSIGTSVYGQTVEKLAEERGFDASNYLNAVLNASAEALLEKALGFSDAESFRKLVTPTGSAGKSIGKAILEYAGDGLEEGLEEVVNAPLSEIIDRMTGVSKNTKLVGEGGIFDLSAMAESGLDGAVVGFLMGGVGAASSIASAVAESGNIRDGLRDIADSQKDLPEAYHVDIPDMASATMEDFNETMAKHFDMLKQYEEDIASGKITVPDTENTADDTAENAEESNGQAAETVQTAAESAEESEISQEETAENATVEKTAAIPEENRSIDEDTAEDTGTFAETIADEDSPISRAVRIAETDVYTAGQDLVESYDGDVKKAVDALYEEGRNLQAQGTDESKARLEVVDTLRREVTATNAQRLESGRTRLAKEMRRYGVQDVVVDDSLAEEGKTGNYGYYKPVERKIYVSPLLSSDAVLGAVTVHELTHHTAKADNTLVRDILAAKDAMVADGILDASLFDMEKYRDEYQDMVISYGKTEAGQAAVQAYVEQGMSRKDAVYQVIDDYLNEEIAAHFMQEMLRDPDFASKVKPEHRGLLQRILDAIVDMIDRIRGTTDVRAYQRAADRLRGIMEDVSGKSAEKGGVQKTTADGDVRMSLDMDTETLYRQLDELHKIGRKSVNAFTSAEIQTMTPWAEQLHRELGERSPFFRAWFGDWRAHDTTPVEAVTEKGDTRGTVANKDTGWEVNVSKQIFKETMHHSSGSTQNAVKYLPYIRDITEKAVLLGSESSGKDNPLSVMYHNLYAYTEAEGYPAVLKLTVEELVDEKSTEPIRRDYILHEIKEEPMTERNRLSTPNHSDKGSSINSIADLFAFVNGNDETFDAKPSSEIRNEDGTPKVMYHGTKAQFTVFDKKKAKSSGLYGKGFYFTDSESHSGTYGDSMAVYLNIKKPLSPNTDSITGGQIRSFLEAVAENEDYSIENYGTYDVDEILDGITSRDAFTVLQDVNATAIGNFVEAVQLFNEVNGTEYDGIVVPTETVAFEANQIKSATDNVGTFDSGNADIRFSKEVDESRWAESETFNAELASWERSGRNGDTVLEVGMTGDVLQGLGALENDIYIRGDKISTILEKHPEITLDEIRKIPQILNNPVLILKSSGKKTAGQNTRLVIFGSVKAKNGQPVLSVLDLRPVEDRLVIDDMQKVTSVYTKDHNPVEFIRSSDVLYAEKKVSTRLLRSVGFQMPTELLDSGYVGSISYDERSVKIEGKKFSEVFAENADDVRYSKETRLAEENEYLKRQFVKRQGNEWAKAVKPSERRKYAAQLSGTLQGVSASSIDTQLAKVWKVFEQPIRGKLDTMEVRYDEAAKAAKEVASALIAGARTANLNPLYDQYADLRKRLRETAINPGSAKADIPDYAEWRKGSMGVLRLSDKGISVDTVWDELSGLYPEFFDAAVTDEAERIMVLADVANKLRAVPGNPLYNIEGVSAEDADIIISDMENRLANAILAGYDLTAKETEAAKLEKERVRSENASAKAYAESMRDAVSVQENLENERVRTENAAKQARAEAEGAILRYTDEARGVLSSANDAVTKAKNFEKQVWAEFEREQKAMRQSIRRANRSVEAAQEKVIREQRKAEDARRRQELSAVRKNFMGNLTRVYNTLVDPTKNKHVPDEMRDSVAALLESFAGTRLPSGKTVDFQILSGIREDAYVQAEREALGKIERIQGIIARNYHSEDGGVTENFLRDMKNQVNLLNDMFAEVYTKSPDDRTARPDAASTKNIEYLRQCNRILSMVDKYIRDMNVNFLAGKAIDAREMAESVVQTLSKRKPEKADKFLADVQYDFMTPETYLDRLGPIGREITKAYRRAQNRQASREQSYTEYMKKLTGGKYSTYDVGFNGKLVEIAGNDGKIIRVPKDQIMELYVLWNRPAARRHIRKGGVIFLDELGKELDTRTMVFDTGIEKVFDTLTEEDKKICDGIVKFLSTRCAEWGNEASLYLYGYRKFGDPNYFPMNVSKSHLPGNWDTMDDFARLENMGFTKKLGDSASAPLRIGGIFNTADSHVRSMAAYASYAPVNNDVTRMIDMAGMKGNIEKYLGKRGYSYLTDFIKAVEQNKVRSGDNIAIAKGFDKLGNAYKRAAVSWNISTAMKQPISIVRAFNSIDGKYIARAYGDLINPKKASSAAERMVDSSGVAKMKVLGYSDVGFGKSLRQNYDDAYSPMGDRQKNMVLRQMAKAYEGFTDAGMWLAGKMDEVTWTRIWRACELEVAEQYKGLSFSEQTKKVTERFNEVIGQTQVVDTILDNAPILRSEKAQLYTAFMSEPVKSLNSLISAADAVTEKRTGAKKQLATAAATYAVSNLLLEPIVSIFFSMFRDEEDETDFETVVDKALNLWIGIPAGKDGDAWLDSEEGKDRVSELVAGGMSEAKAKEKAKREYVWGDFGVDFISSQVFSNLTGAIPYVNSLIDAVTNTILGYDNDRIDMANISKTVQSTMNLVKSYTGNGQQQKSQLNLWVTAVEDALSVAGVPAKTLRRDLTAVARTVLQATDSYNVQWELNKLLYNINSSSARTQKGFFDIMAKAARAGDTEAYKRMSDDLETILTTSSVGIKRSTILSQLKKRGYEPEVGSELWYIDLQAGFDLDTFNPNMTAEKMITDVYRKTGSDSVLPQSPSNSFSVNGETVKISDPLEYQAFAEEVGDYSYQILVNMAASDAYNALADSQKEYAIEKAYDYARKRSRKKLYAEYDMNNTLFTELYEKNASPSAAANGIIGKAKEQK